MCKAVYKVGLILTSSTRGFQGPVLCIANGQVPSNIVVGVGVLLLLQFWCIVVATIPPFAIVHGLFELHSEELMDGHESLVELSI